MESKQLEANFVGTIEDTYPGLTKMAVIYVHVQVSIFHTAWFLSL